MAKLAALPMKPLWDLVRARLDNPEMTQVDFANAIHTTDRAVTRWVRNGGMIPWVSADESAIRFGLHPVLVWGSAWTNLRSGPEAEEVLGLADDDDVLDVEGFEVLELMPG